MEAKEVEMGCWHGQGHYGHGCGPWHDGPYVPSRYGPVDWFGPADWDEEFERPIRRRRRSSRYLEGAPAGEELEARLDELRAEIKRVEANLAELRGAGETSPG